MNEMSVSKMFIAENAYGGGIKLAEFSITGASFEPSGQVLHHGRVVNCYSGEFETLTELATICAMCNDSAVEYNEVTKVLDGFPVTVCM